MSRWWSPTHLTEFRGVAPAPEAEEKRSYYARRAPGSNYARAGVRAQRGRACGSATQSPTPLHRIRRVPSGPSDAALLLRARGRGEDARGAELSAARVEARESAPLALTRSGAAG